MRKLIIGAWMVIAISAPVTALGYTLDFEGVFNQRTGGGNSVLDDIYSQPFVLEIEINESSADTNPSNPYVGIYSDAVVSARLSVNGSIFEGLNVRGLNILRAGSPFAGAQQVSEDRLNTGGGSAGVIVDGILDTSIGFSFGGPSAGGGGFSPGTFPNDTLSYQNLARDGYQLGVGNQYGWVQGSLTLIPEPSTAVLISLGLINLGIRRRN